MKIGIYGGTFNPPHLGHLAAARAAAEALELDKLILVPAAIPPHKDLPKDTPGPQHRLEMTARIAEVLETDYDIAAEVSSVELTRYGRSYTAETLKQIRLENPDAELWFLTGTDMFLTLHQWRDPASIMKLAGICALARHEGESEETLAAQKAFLEDTYGARTVTMTVPDLVDISSSQIREMLPRGEGSEYLLPAVYGHILMNGLYGTRADLTHLDLPELRACSWSMVRRRRVPHIIGCEEEAAKLARRWGEDETAARRAGILHDCTKYLELEPQLEICRRYGVELDDLEKVAVKLLHSKTGACIARYVFGEDERVCSAIAWHTTAKEDMTTLEKILYVADYIEPNRHFEGVERLRRLAYTSLDSALLLGVETTIQEMKDRQLPIHRKTLLARDWLRKQGVETGED